MNTDEQEIDPKWVAEYLLNWELRLELSEIDLLVWPRAEHNRLNAVEVHVVDAAKMPRQLVDNFAAVCFPHIYIPVEMIILEA